MIFVTLGTQDKSFERLLKAIQKQIDNGTIKEKVIVQCGHTNFKSNDMQIHEMLSIEDFNKYIDKCDLLITHGGVGSILDGICKNKPVIAAARLKEFKEHTNDHQKQIIDEFEKEGYILKITNLSKLGEVLEQAKTFKPKKYVSNTQNFIKQLENYIDNN